MTVARHAAGALLALLCLSLLPATAAADGAAPTAARVAIEVPATDAVRVGVPSHVSVALVEGSTGQVLVAQDATTRRPIASAIKLVTALSVIDALPADTVVTLGDEVRGVGGSSYGLRPGERRTVEDLLTGLLLRSGNDAAVALGVAVAGSEADFTARMSETLGALGIDARPASASGLEEADALSALELATVARAALDEPRIAALVRNEEVVRPDGRTIENRNRFVGVVEGATGLKTGFTNAAGFTLAASAERGGRELIAVVLGAHDDDQRLEIAARMIEHGFSATRPDDLASSLELRTSRGTTAPPPPHSAGNSQTASRSPPPDSPYRSHKSHLPGSSPHDGTGPSARGLKTPPETPSSRKTPATAARRPHQKTPQRTYPPTAPNLSDTAPRSPCSPPA